MAQRVEIGNMPPESLVRMAMENKVPQSPAQKQQSFYERQLEMTCPGRIPVL